MLPLRHVLQIRYHDIGGNLVHAKTIPEGVKIAADPTCSIDIVLLDLVMPCVSGPLEALTYIKKITQPVACFSAHDDRELRQAASDAGAVAFISKDTTKPFEERLRPLDKLIEHIQGAKARMKTEAVAGMRLRSKSRDFKLATLVTLIGLASAVLGGFGTSFVYGKVYGTEKQAAADHFIALDKKSESTEKEIANKAGELQASIGEVAKKQEASSAAITKFLRLMDLNVRMLLQKNNITPARDGE